MLKQTRLSVGLAFLAFVVLVLGTSLALIGTQQTQETRTRASGPTPTPVPPTPVREGSSSARGSNVSTLTFSHTMTANPNRLLMVGVAMQGSTTTVSSITYANVPLAKLTRTVGNQTSEELWYLVGVPNTGANNVVVNLSAKSSSFVIGATAFSNVHQTMPFGTIANNSGTGTTASVTVNNTNANQLVMDVLTSYYRVSATPNGGQTILWNMPGDGTTANYTLGAASVKNAGANSTTSTWTFQRTGWGSSSRNWLEIGVAINPFIAPTSTPAPTATPTPGPATPTPTFTPTPTPVAASNNPPFVCTNGCTLGGTDAGTRFAGKNYKLAMFRNANLISVNLTGSDMTDASLRGADASDANLTNVNMTNVNATDADFTDAITTGANVTGVTWSNTTCPDGSNSDTNPGSTCVGYGF